MSKRKGSVKDEEEEHGVTVKKIKTEKKAFSDVNRKRMRVIKHVGSGSSPSEGSVVYWMWRDQRCDDNWALLYALEEAKKRNGGISVLVPIPDKYMEYTERQYDFMIMGLRETEVRLSELNIDFHVKVGYPSEIVKAFVEEVKPSLIVCDFTPLKAPMSWLNEVKDVVNVSIHQVDAHNIVPCWVASDKIEYAARTIRPKIHNHLPEFLTEFPPLVKFETSVKEEHTAPPIDWDSIKKCIKADNSPQLKIGLFPDH